MFVVGVIILGIILGILLTVFINGFRSKPNKNKLNGKNNNRSKLK